MHSSWLFVPVSLLKKKDNHTPLDVRPISVVSVFMSTYTGLRFSQTLSWQAQTLPSSIVGGRKGMSTATVGTAISLMLESAPQNHPMIGISLDRSKCFDSIHATFATWLMVKLGLPAGLGMTISNFYSSSNRYFRVARRCGPAFKSFSMLQGCSFSVLAVNLLFSVLIKRLETAAPRVISFYYIDDAHMMAPAAHAEQFYQAVEETTTFDALIGQHLNLNKSTLFATTTTTRKTLLHKYPDMKIAHVLKVLGYSFSTVLRPTRKNADQRVQDAIDGLKSFQYLPLTVNRLQQLVKIVTLPKAFYGCELNLPSLAKLASLGTMILKVLFSVNKRYCERNLTFLLCTGYPTFTCF
jgi:hypothetical protein